MPQKAIWGKKLDLLNVCVKDRNTIKGKGRKSFTCLHEKKLKANHWGKNYPTITISPKQNCYPLFLKDLQLRAACSGKCSKAKCTPILGGLASSRPPIDIWNPLPKALLASKEMSEKSAFPEAHFCSALLTPLPAPAQMELGFQTHPNGILRSLV